LKTFRQFRAILSDIFEQLEVERQETFIQNVTTQHRVPSPIATFRYAEDVAACCLPSLSPAGFRVQSSRSGWSYGNRNVFHHYRAVTHCFNNQSWGRGEGP